AIVRAAPDILHDIERRLLSGEPWTTKRMRQRSAYLWRMIDRGTIKPTPRGWFANLCVVEIDNGDAAPLSCCLGSKLVERSTENIHHCRKLALQDGLTGAKPDTLLSLTPLRWINPTHFVAWVFNGKTLRNLPSEIAEVRMQLTRELEVVISLLSAESRPVAIVVSALCVQAGLDDRLATLFLDHLASIGIVEIERRPQQWTRTMNIGSD